MTRMVEQPQPSTSSTTTNTTNQNQPFSTGPSSGARGADPFSSLLGNLLNNPNQMIQMTSMILGDESGNINMNNLNNLLGGLTSNQPSQSNQMDLNALLNNIINPQGQPGQSQPAQSQTNTQQQSSSSTSSTNPYPMLDAPYQHIQQLNVVTDSISGITSNPLPNVPNLNYPLNILTAVGNTLRKYYQALGRFLPLIEVLSESLQRESIISSQEEREKVKSLIRQVKQGLDEIINSSGPVSTILHGLDFGNAPGQGVYRLIAGATVEMRMNVPEEIPQQNIQNNAHQQEQSMTSPQPGTIIANNPEESRRRSTANPLENILAQMSQPGNMQAMMSMVGNMLGNQGQSRGSQGAQGSGPSSSQQANPLGNLISQLMGGLNNPEEDSVPQSAQEYFTNLINNSQQRKSTMIKDIPSNVLTLEPQPDFKILVDNLISQLTIQEIIDFKSVNFRGLTRLRRSIRQLINEYLVNKFNNNRDKLIDEVKDMILERLMNHESEEDKIINQNLDTEPFIRNIIKNIIELFLDENSSDIKFENSLRRTVLLGFGELFEYLIGSYNSKEEGALYYIDSNIEDLLIAILGQNTLDVIFNLNDGIIEEFTDNLSNLYPSEKSKSGSEEENPSGSSNNVRIIFKNFL
jgi:hypothetical protein